MLPYLLSTLPVFLFLLLLVLLDSFSLMKRFNFMFAFFWGIISLIPVNYLNQWGIENAPFFVYKVPLFEEFFKALGVLFLIKTHRTAFFVDALLYGACSGAGFALLENIHYIRLFPDMLPGTALIRGAGTALMHCATVAGTAAILNWFILRRGHCIRFYLISLLPAILFHSLYNTLLLPPFISLAVTVCGTVAWMTALIFQNEKFIRKWIEMELSEEVRLLKSIKNGKFSESLSGKYLYSLKNSFSAEKLLDIYCYLGLYIELSLLSKRNIMLKETGIPIPEDKKVRRKLKEFFALSKEIGKSGRLALAPIIKQDNLRQWKINTLK